MVDKIFHNPQLDTVLIKLASRCNINCSYCYVYNMGDSNWTTMEKQMTEPTMLAIAKSLTELADFQDQRFSIVLHGGEPLLIGAKKLDFFLSLLRNSLGVDYPISIQTNGILISSQILDICSKNKTSIAVSIDGYREINDKFRIGHNNKGTFDQVINGINILKSHPDHEFLNAGLLAVIDPSSDPEKIYSFFKELEAPSVDFLYKDGNHSILPLGKSAIDSTEYGEWMTKLLKVYLNDKNPLPIRILDDMLKVLLGGTVSKEGMGITDYGIVIIDTNGIIMKNDTLKSSFDGADKFKKPINIKDGKLLDFIGSKEFNEYREMQRPSSEKCLRCPILNICGGGMILHRWKDGSEFNNTSVYCADQLHLVENMKQLISKFYLINA
ncbi:cyclophane-forming radical SAM/SPASM peptide maturase YhhB [Chryseobacterium soli]|uniref:cyclophane-forming radical SAM/SPASM peptide maturase YhhB n=1 Tax=Chryseobacterium soli TaxID=445961 RepID=UPI0013F4075A|nr:cyclophane-forming radical SAM/SPASM peptide maturase YhhB [Chryseobacterium soli]